MKLFLRKVLAGGLVILFYAFLLDYVITMGLRKMDDYRFQTWDAILDGGMTHDGIIMGNSRAFSHFNPVIIDSICQTDAYDLGIGGYPMNVQLARWNTYVAHNTLPKYVIYNVDPMTFARIEDVRHQHQSEQFFLLCYDAASRKEMRQLGYGFLELYVPLYRYLGYQQVIKNGLLEFFHVKHYVDPSIKGFRPERGEWNGVEYEKMEPHVAEMDSVAINQFVTFLDDCRNKDIKVVMVFSPMYQGAVGKITNMDDSRAQFSELAANTIGYYLDYLDDPICLDTANFCVSVHMNAESTDRFTTQLCEDLLRLNVIE